MDWKRLEEIAAHANAWERLGHERVETRVSQGFRDLADDPLPKHAVLDSRDMLWLCQQIREMQKRLEELERSPALATTIRMNRALK